MKAGYLMCWTLIMFCSFIFFEKTLPVEGNPIKVLSIQNKGQTIDIKLGESFQVILPNPGSGGYIVQDPEFDSRILTLQKMEKKPPSESSREGDFGSLEWTFEAKEKGASEIILRASRPWEKNKAPIVLFEATIQVTQ